VIRDELVNILAAGRDTTASLLTFTMYILTERPDLTAKLRNKILEFVGPNTQLTYKNITDMKYLQAFLNGNFLPIYIPMGVRHVFIFPFKFKSLIFNMPLCRCVYSVFLMHHREDLWGTDALEFDPECFIDKRAHQYLIPNPFIFKPFNVGPRICIGQQFAYNEVSYFLIKFLQSFTNFGMDWDVQPETSRPPAEWETSRAGSTKGRDRVILTAHLTMAVKVLVIFMSCCLSLLRPC
ncbi:cytochrome P450, partial [Gymnopus androsaceus JB14]